MADLLKGSRFIKYRFFIFSSLLLFVLLTAALIFTLTATNKKGVNNPDFIYKTWKVQKFYQNGKLVINSKKFSELKLKVNHDGTAEWIRPDGKQVLVFKVNNDATQIYTDTQTNIEDIETIFELKKEKLRFGKRNIISHYEYVLVPEEN